MNIAKFLRKAAKNWDGGYAMAGMLGHGDAFVLEILLVFDPLSFMKMMKLLWLLQNDLLFKRFLMCLLRNQRINPGSAIIIKKSGETSFKRS